MKANRTVNYLLICSGIFIGTLYFVRLNEAPIKVREIPSIAESLPLLIGNTISPDLSKSVTFIDETFISGISHRHTQKKDKISSFEDSLGAGVCAADFNNDGWDDLFFISGSGNRRHFGRENWWQAPIPNQLYLNESGINLKNISNTSGIKENSFGIACATADLNSDGLVDIIVANKGKNAIYQNLDGKTFKIVENIFKNDDDSFSTSILIYDFNNDGKNDVLFGNYVTFRQEQNVLELNAGFETQKNINFDTSLYEAQPDALFLNNGDFSFTENSSLLEKNRHGRTLGFFVDDSILALNDRGSPSQIIYAHPNTSKLDSIVLNARDAKKINAPKGATEELFVASDASNGGIYALTMDGQSNDRSWDYRINHEKRLFATTWAILDGDFNLDGLDDIFLSNGSIMPHPDASRTSTGQPNTLLVANINTEKFDTQPLKNERILSSRGAATFDFNNDGKLDIIVSNNNDYPTLMINRSEINRDWIGLKCIPEEKCKKGQLLIEGNIHKKGFRSSINYASQSSGAVIAKVSSKAHLAIEFQLEGKKIELVAANANSYYQIDIENKSISKIAPIKNVATSSALADREEFIFLLKTGNGSDRFFNLISSLARTNTENKNLIISMINATQNRLAFPLVDFWANDTDQEIATASIRLLKSLETEESIPTLINLIHSENDIISCSAIEAFRFFYWKDEAVTERKGWAEPELIKTLDSASPLRVACAIDALAESESFRALHPLIKLLESDSHVTAMKSARALGMLRQTEAIPYLRHSLTNSLSPFVRAESFTALIRLKADISNIKAEDILKKGSSDFNEALSAALRISDDGIAANKLYQQLINIAPTTTHLSTDKSSLAELVNAYETKNGRSIELDPTYFNDKQKSHSDKQTNLANRLLSMQKKDQFNAFDTLDIRSKLELIRSNIKIRNNMCSRYESFKIKNLNVCENSKSIDSEKISEIMQHSLNSGHYEQAAIASIILSDNPGYTLAINHLLADTTIQNSEKLYLLENFQLGDLNMDLIINILATLDEQSQLNLLRSIEGRTNTDSFSKWISTYAATSQIPAIQFYAKGFNSDKDFM